MADFSMGLVHRFLHGPSCLPFMLVHRFLHGPFWRTAPGYNRGVMDAILDELVADTGMAVPLAARIVKLIRESGASKLEVDVASPCPCNSWPSYMLVHRSRPGPCWRTALPVRRSVSPLAPRGRIAKRLGWQYCVRRRWMRWKLRTRRPSVYGGDLRAPDQLTFGWRKP